MKQLIPTDIDEYIAEHKAGDVVSGRVVEQSRRRYRVELGEGIRADCRTAFATAAAPVAAEVQPNRRNPAKPDLSSLSSMLQSPLERQHARRHQPSPSPEPKARSAASKSQSSTRNRRRLKWSWPSRKALQIHLIDIAPLPVLSALGGLDQWMLRLMEMRPRMTARRRVAAAHMPALQAHPQMQPLLAQSSGTPRTPSSAASLSSGVPPHDCKPQPRISTSNLAKSSFSRYQQDARPVRKVHQHAP